MPNCDHFPGMADSGPVRPAGPGWWPGGAARRTVSSPEPEGLG
jgi:hypothetical protein